MRKGRTPDPGVLRPRAMVGRGAGQVDGEYRANGGHFTNANGFHLGFMAFENQPSGWLIKSPRGSTDLSRYNL